MDDLGGRVAVITGGASGIGLATAMALAREGTHCVLADIETLRRDYEPLLAEAEPGIKQLLADAATALDGVVSRTLTPEGGPASG